MKTTKVAITLELTSYQAQELTRLGEILWSGAGLTMSELCRRILLDGADGMRAGEALLSEPEPRHLLANADLPKGGTVAEWI